MGGNSNHNLSQEGSDVNNRLLQVENTLSRLEKMMEDLTNKVKSLELQRANFCSSSVSSNATTESTNSQASSSSSHLEQNTERELVPSKVGTGICPSDSSPSQLTAKTTIDIPDHQVNRHYSDSKVAGHRRYEVRKKVGPMKPRPFSAAEQINVSIDV